MKRIKKIVSIATITMIASAITAIVASADNSSATAAMNTAFTSIAGDITATMTSVLPIALGIVGMIIVIRFGIKWFKSLVGRG